MIPLEHINEYSGEHHVLKDITLSVKQEEKIVIIGPSGPSKSTLIRCMNQLKEVNDGSVVIDNIDITKPKAPIQKVHQKVAVVFQSFNLYAHKAIINNLTLAPIKVMGISKDGTVCTGIEYLKRVGLVDKTLAYPPQLPGRQQQRVAVARALNMYPEIILFDEPTSALDPGMIQEVLDVMADLSRQNIIMVCVTHEMGFAHQAANRVVLMDQGQIIEQGTSEHFFTSAENPRVRESLSKIIHNE